MTCFLYHLWSPIWFLTAISLPCMQGCQVILWLVSQRSQRKENTQCSTDLEAFERSDWSWLTLSLLSRNSHLPRLHDISVGMCRGSQKGIFKRKTAKAYFLWSLREWREKRHQRESFLAHNNFWIHNFLSFVLLSRAKPRNRPKLNFLCVIVLSVRSPNS